MKSISLIGSTGSIGRQVLNVVRANPDKFKICALVCNTASSEFAKQVEEFKPDYTFIASQDKDAVRAAYLDEADIVFNAAGGFAGLEYSLKAVENGKKLALANKETLVCAGSLIALHAKMTGAEIMPVDSEHSAIWQCLNYDLSTHFKKLIITASGGAFRNLTKEELEKVTPEQALNHPTWKMGAKITVDSATLMNKGYEVIEAHELYKCPYEKIQTVLQPTSIVHSLVEFEDGGVLAQMGTPSMELPITLALTYPERIKGTATPLDFTKAFNLEFLPLVRKNYPLYDLALRCGEAGGTLPCALNAADEVAVRAFLNKKIPFTRIYSVVAEVISAAVREDIKSFEQLKEVDYRARKHAEEFINRL